MITRCSLTKWILSEAFLLALAVHPVVNQKDSSACCYADAQSERSILRDSSLTDEQRKVHYQKLRYLRDEKRKNSATDASSVRNDNSASQKKPQKQRLPSFFCRPRDFSRHPRPGTWSGVNSGGRTALSTLVLSAHGHQGGDLLSIRHSGLDTRQCEGSQNPWQSISRIFIYISH